MGAGVGAKGVEKICEDNHLFIYAHVYLAAYANADENPGTYHTIETRHKKTQTNTHTHTGSGSLDVVGVDIIGMLTIIGANGGANIGAGASPGLGA